MVRHQAVGPAGDAGLRATLGQGIEIGAASPKKLSIRRLPRRITSSYDAVTSAPRRVPSGPCLQPAGKDESGEEMVSRPGFYTVPVFKGGAAVRGAVEGRIRRLTLRRPGAPT